MVHLSPLDPVRSLSRKLVDSGARIMVAPEYPTMLPQALELLADGLLDHLVIGRKPPGAKAAHRRDAAG